MRLLFVLAFLAIRGAASDDASPLHMAVYNDDLAAARRLIAAGADVKATNRYDVTPLSLACQNGNVDLIGLLLDAGADPNTALPGGETALMTAARTGRAAAVKLLLSRGADVHVKESKRGQTALMWAAADGHAETVEVLLRAGADFKTRLSSGFTPLLFAVREGHIPAVRALLKAGASPNETIQPAPNYSRGRGAPRPGTSALVLATTNAHYDLAAFLLDTGADPNADLCGYTALHTISWVRKPGLGDNDPAPQGSGRLTSFDLVRKLVAHKANINARMTKRVGVGLTSLNTLGATPFLLAARTADAALMRLLAELGADPLLPTADNSTPLIVAAGLGTRSPGEDAGTEQEAIEAVKVALELGNDINAVDNNGETAMHGAAYKNLPGVVRLLAAKGADPAVWNRNNKQGWTPLLIAEGYRFGNFKPSLVTVAAFHEILKSAQGREARRQAKEKQ